MRRHHRNPLGVFFFFCHTAGGGINKREFPRSGFAGIPIGIPGSKTALFWEFPGIPIQRKKIALVWYKKEKEVKTTLSKSVRITVLLLVASSISG